MALLKVKLPWTNYNGLLGPIDFVNSEAVVPGVRSDNVFQRLDSILSGITYEVVEEEGGSRKTSFKSTLARSNAKPVPKPRPAPKPRQKPQESRQSASQTVDTGATFDEVEDDEPVPVKEDEDDDGPGDMLASDALPPRALPPSPVELEARIKAVQAAAAKKSKTLVGPTKKKKGK